MTPKRLRLLLALAAFVAADLAPAFAQSGASEQAVRAALVFNFIKFTEWPEATGGEPQLRLCIASGDPAQIAALEALGERRVRNMPLATLRRAHPPNCDVIYVGSSQRWSEIAPRLGGLRALTIGGYAGFAADGGMIEISLQDGNARFDINLPEAKRAGLRFYPQLLRLARRVME